MKETELRAMIRESSLKPVRICMDDGKSYTISHPDFALVADGAVIVGGGPGHAAIHLSAVLVASIEPLMESKTKRRKGH